MFNKNNHPEVLNRARRYLNILSALKYNKKIIMDFSTLIFD